MAGPVVDGKLMSALLVELQTLEASAVVMPLVLKPAEAWFLLGFLQVTLRQPGIPAKPREVIMELARNIEGRITNGRPAMQEAAIRGWTGDLAALWGAGPPPEPPKTEGADEPEAARPQGDSQGKRKPEVTPQNKAIVPPENKGGVGTRRRKLQ